MSTTQHAAADRSTRADECPGTLIYAGIDEAGYGPKLGPLCVAMSAFEIADWSTESGPPDLWRVLSKAVSREPQHGRRSRVPVADSKKLKRPHSSRRIHPLADLELGVLSFLDRSPQSVDDKAAGEPVLEALGCRIGELPPWYDADLEAFPVTGSAEFLALRSQALGRALREAGVRPILMRSVVIDETRFNREVRDRARTKSRVSFEAVGELIRELLTLTESLPEQAPAPRIVIDRQGGRIRYDEELSRILPGSRIRMTHESRLQSRYEIECASNRDRPGSVVLTVQVQAEDDHLPVALASMVAKYVRELLMMRFNDYWRRALPSIELKPTAGYGVDAKRWLNDVSPSLGRERCQELWRDA